MRYRVRTLLILLAIGPPILAGAWFHATSFRALFVYVLLVIYAWQLLAVIRSIPPPVKS